MNKSYTIIVCCILSLFFIEGISQETEIRKLLVPVYPEIKPVCDCEKLTGVSIPNTTVISATLDVKSNSCMVTAIVNHPPADDSVKVWIALPLKDWNGRFEGTGGGGFLGGRPELSEPLSQRFAAGSTNTGHEDGSGSFALNNKRQLNWQLIQDNAYLGIHDMTVVGKELVKAFYGKPAKYSYFVGGSTGGRQGLSEAQRFPGDYNGILSFYPAINWHRFLVADLWPQVVMHELNNYIPAPKFEAINKAIIEDVDAKDGYSDGVIENALDLKYDPKILIGKMIGGSIFTDTDAEVISKIWEGPRSMDGQFLWYGLVPGTVFFALANTQGDPLTGKPFGIAAEYVRYYLKSDPDWQGTSISMKEFQLLWNQSVEQYGSVLGTDNPNLKPFNNNGGKILIIHGMNDNQIYAQGSVNYYKRVQEIMGGEKTTCEFARLFLIPGMDHNYRNPALKPIDHFESLINWVEYKVAPEKIKVEHRDKSGTITRTAYYNFWK